MLGVNVDFRYIEGYPELWEAIRHGVGIVRVLSLPQNEQMAENFMLAGIKVLAVYTGESDDAGKYVLKNASAIQIGNEPLMNLPASWPSGNANAVVAVWMRIRDRVWFQHGQWFPLVGPGIWSQDYAKWALLSNRIEGVTAAAVHVYPESSGHTPIQVAASLERYRAVRPDIPLLCTEWTARWPDVLQTARIIDDWCDARCWYTWHDPGQPHHSLNGTPELGILAWV